LRNIWQSLRWFESEILRQTRSHRLDSTLRRTPDEFVHLKLKTNVQLVHQNPFDDLPRVDPSENWRKKHGAAAGRQIVTLHFVARPFVILAGAHYKFRFVAHGEMVNVRPEIFVRFAAAGRL